MQKQSSARYKKKYAIKLSKLLKNIRNPLNSIKNCLSSPESCLCISDSILSSFSAHHFLHIRCKYIHREIETKEKFPYQHSSEQKEKRNWGSSLHIFLKPPALKFFVFGENPLENFHHMSSFRTMKTNRSAKFAFFLLFLSQI